MSSSGLDSCLGISLSSISRITNGACDVNYPSQLSGRGIAPAQELMPSAFHTFKLVPMAPTTTRQPTPILPPGTPSNSNARPSSSQQTTTTNNQNNDTPTSTPTAESRMNPPPLPRALVTPVREMRESSIVSSGGSARKPRQNLDERDHILMVKHCYEQRHNYKEGTKAQFWTGVNSAFQTDTGKVLAQMSATVGRLVEARRRQIADWESGVIPEKPDGPLNEQLDLWMEFLKVEDADAEAERMRQVDTRRKVEEARKEARRQAIAAESLVNAQNPQARMITGPPPPPQMSQGQPQHPQHPPPQQQQQHEGPPPPPPSGGEMMQHQQPNGETDMNGYRPQKRRRMNERALTQELQAQLAHDQWQAQQYALAHPPEPPKRVVVEGAMTKEDWRDVMGNDARLRTLETKVDKIELLVAQNNKLLLQLIQNQSNKERDRNTEEDRVPVHLDAEFERDYL
ncbi:hypothetical protein G7Y89_g6961 [Cudoniella acicularis]|uniref:Uncharacterized protein n=1 Tax=Cudoniella acicularis TaxID=354080 RepID=A0A8H4W497_9HELO|nr:hypothetical protein G7Y89_g6961 [Cudoniella acicularis]